MIGHFLFSGNFNRCLILGFLFSFSLLAFGQSSSTSINSPTLNSKVAADSRDTANEGVFAPFVSRLRVAVRDPQIRLTWQDIPDFGGTYQIYRHTEEIGIENLDKATLVAEVDPGEEFYTDIPPTSGQYFYVVLAKDSNDVVYKVFIPFRNKTLTSIGVAVTPQSQDLASDISNFQATLNGAAIQVNLDSSRNTRNIAIFRSTSLMKTVADLSAALQIWTGTGRQISYADYAVPGVPYYYAAIDVEAFQKGVAVLEINHNSLSQPVEIPLGARPSIIAGLNTPRTVRVMPLPVLTLPDLSDQQLSLDGTNPVQVNTPLNPQVKNNIAKLSAGLRNTALITPKAAELLPSDRLQIEGKLSAPIQGEAKALTEILDKDFTKRNWDESSRQLNNYLTLPLSQELIAKGHYYLAQSYYQNGRYREALLEFLYVQDELPEYAQPWIDSTLSLSSAW